jgi:hypothetical protein
MFLLVQIIDDERQRLLCVQGLSLAIHNGHQNRAEPHG